MVTNISCYKFAKLTELKSLRERLLTLCKERSLKGTILLSTEGINLFVAGPRSDIDFLVSQICLVPGLQGLAPKYSQSNEQPFTRMLVRIKKEIIAFGVDGINPAERTSPKLGAKELKRWLDEGRPVTLLDTRNDYEVKLGTFEKATPIGVNHFRDFPAAVRRLPESLKEQPVVMFCTGGIRCEKAGPFMEREGFRQIYQLDGGILKYFEECGGAHYQGECFVFDHRVGLDPALHETSTTQCCRCQTPLTPEDQTDPRYVAFVSCPYCYKSSEEQMREQIAMRETAISRVTNPLPGSTPYRNLRPLNVPARMEGATVADFLNGLLPQFSSAEWQGRCVQGLVLKDSEVPVSGTERVRVGERYYHVLPGTVEPAVSPDIRILHEDEALVVLNKPAPLPVHPSGRFNRNTLQFILRSVYAPQKPRPAHRLDANTTGVLICARTRHFAGLLQKQFAEGTVEKTYVVRVHGHPKEDEFACDAPISAEPSELGARTIDRQQGLPALTNFRVLHRLEDGSALLEARPETGRTNQIRLHLHEMGYPVCGDPVYGEHPQTTQTLEVDAPPLCLHAWRLAVQHPLSRKRVLFEAPLPLWAAPLSQAGLGTSEP